ncbi:hypothetical protein Pmani_016290 [Petrolisthes manimaculis]|uniref:Uncharacterized protein n=1 Tax=Petrolisthes manimaculis TaxID=1843537 RepID=A0AAE1PQ11_9EUCA|nr:hypothetical protein Pmani_016290 [Petrolisthes manimaculis]
MEGEGEKREMIWGCDGWKEVKKMRSSGEEWSKEYNKAQTKRLRRVTTSEVQETTRREDMDSTFAKGRA